MTTEGCDTCTRTTGWRNGSRSTEPASRRWPTAIELIADPERLRDLDLVTAHPFG
jgi:hypothetical protein